MVLAPRCGWRQKIVTTNDGVTDSEKLAMLKRLTELELECENLRKGRILFQRKRSDWYAFIKEAKAGYPLRHLLSVAGVSRSAYYAWAAQQAKTDFDHSC